MVAGLAGGSFLLFNRILGGAGPAPNKVADSGARPLPAPAPEPVSTKRDDKQPPSPKKDPPPETKEHPGTGQSVGKLNPAAPVLKDSNWFVCYPPSGQDRVPLIFPGNETPDPLAQTSEKLSGYPITLTFAPRTVVRDAAAELQDSESKSVPVWLSSPEKPANPRHPREQANTICLLAKKPLNPGSTYSVSVSATVDGQPWKHSWSFTAISRADLEQEIDSAVLQRFNDYRRQAGLETVALDPDRSLACRNHARYLALNLPKHEDLKWNDEDAKLPGHTPEGQKTGAAAAIFVGGGPVGLIDWNMASFFNRHVMLEPSLRRIGLGYALFPGRGWVWVLSIRADRPMGPIGVPMLYPRDQQEDVPTGYPMRSRPLPMPAGDKQEAGPAITLWMPSRSNLSDVTARLTDSDGREAALWLSTPDQPAVAGFSQHWIGMIPKEALKEATTYTVTVQGKQGAGPWRKSWSFRTIRYDDRKEPRGGSSLGRGQPRSRRGSAGAGGPRSGAVARLRPARCLSAPQQQRSIDPGPGHARRAPGAPGLHRRRPAGRPFLRDRQRQQPAGRRR